MRHNIYLALRFIFVFRWATSVLCIWALQKSVFQGKRRLLGMIKELC